MKSFFNFTSFFLAVVGLSAAISARAETSVYNGELFGYRLGDCYEVTSKTMGRFNFALGHAIIVADNPVKPRDINTVELIATPKTLTIGNILGKKKFKTKQDAEAFAWKYYSVFSAAYPNAKTVDHSLYSPAPKVLKQVGKYHLSVMYFEPRKGDKDQSYLVHIGLQVGDNEASKEVDAMFKREMEELIVESAKERGDLQGIK